jgi:methyl coenzyme M reductase subunit C
MALRLCTTYTQRMTRMSTEELVVLLNTGRNADDLATATAALHSMTLAEIGQVDRHPELICHAYGGTKTKKITQLIGGIRRDMSSSAIARTGGAR